MKVGAVVRRLSRAAARGERDGAAAVEFALFAGVFLTILAATVDIGSVLYTQFQLDAAIAAGAQYAVVNAQNVGSSSGASLASSIATTVSGSNGSGWADTTVVINNGPSVTITGGSSSSSGTASNADSCYCLTGSPGSWSWGGATSCGSSCADGGPSGKFVTIVASRAITALFPTFGYVTNGTVTQSAAIEVQ